MSVHSRKALGKVRGETVAVLLARKHGIDLSNQNAVTEHRHKFTVVGIRGVVCGNSRDMAAG